MHKGFLKSAALLGALSVMLGAFAAHGLKSVADMQTVTTFETGVRYQFYHVFAIALVGILYKSYTNNLIVRAGTFFLIGIGLFSGSLYLYTLKVVANIIFLDWVVFITPLGGISFIIGWICLFVGIKELKA